VPGYTFVIGRGGRVDARLLPWEGKTRGSALARRVYKAAGAPAEGVTVDPTDILGLPDSASGDEALHIDPKGPEAEYQIDGIVAATTSGLFRVRFHVTYHVAGRPGETKPTDWIYVQGPRR
jgi:hypothetical protein